MYHVDYKHEASPAEGQKKHKAIMGIGTQVNIFNTIMLHAFTLIVITGVYVKFEMEIISMM